MKKELFFDRYCGQQFAALVEDGKLAEFSAENERRGEMVGNIYKGRVTNVLAGMNAAFLSCGLARNCYLSMEETYTDYTKYDGTLVETNAKPLGLKEGDELIVQVTKTSRGNKGAKVTTHLSFVGKCLIYLPQTDFLGISRKITDEEERGKLLKIADKMRTRQNEGFIVRTQAPFATQKQLKAEAAYLKKLYAHMCETAKEASVGALLYEDEDLPTRMLRDSFGEDIAAIHVGDDELFKRLQKLVALRKDISERKLVKYTGARSMMNEYGIIPLAYDAVRPTAALESGGYLVFDHTEAMTVVDVNSGSYIGGTSLEETVFAVNLEAAREIARQVRLRNVGGIVVVDFIDMADEAHKAAVTEELKRCLARDKAKCNVLPMSEFCLVQFTRKRVGSEALSFLVKPCPHCEGNGHVHEDIFVFTHLRDALLDCFAEGHTSAIVDLNEGIMRKILSEGVFSIEARSRWKDKRVYFIGHKTYKEEYFTVRGENADILQLPDKAQILY
ncbi:MAG: Rne/Rng family ribonuclease [Clostridia bacterium]|nr:Rne/Rng family ribonuclease [Clostridia bacterium]